MMTSFRCFCFATALLPFTAVEAKPVFAFLAGGEDPFLISRQGEIRSREGSGSVPA
jgi:hypothetical protein